MKLPTRIFAVISASYFFAVGGGGGGGRVSSMENTSVLPDECVRLQLYCAY